jgi:hypothetical protein
MSENNKVVNVKHNTGSVYAGASIGVLTGFTAYDVYTELITKNFNDASGSMLSLAFVPACLVISYSIGNAVSRGIASRNPNNVTITERTIKEEIKEEKRQSGLKIRL